MFTPLYLLPQRNTKDRAKYEERWQTGVGEQLSQKVLHWIREGAGTEFYFSDTEQSAALLESPWDLKGFFLQSEDIEFADTENFKGTNFSYASFYNSKLKGACFYNTNIEFADIHNCEFINCVFAFTSFYGTTFEKTRFINCDFVEYDRITNCDVRDTSFQDCFVPKALFFDCRFDESTKVDTLRSKPNSWFRDALDNKDRAEIYKGIKEGYRAGQVLRQARDYFFEERRSLTKYNSTGRVDKLFGKLLEITAGYGIGPVRVLLTMMTAFLMVSLPFVALFGLSDGLLLSAGAFFTFGANTDKLQTLGLFLRTWYIFGSFLGVSLTALFVTVLANLWFSEK